jgi:hypothetical protein
LKPTSTQAAWSLNAASARFLLENLDVAVARCDHLACRFAGPLKIRKYPRLIAVPSGL